MKASHAVSVFGISVLSSVSAFASHSVTNSGSCFTQTAYAGSAFVCPDRSFVTAVSDFHEPIGRIETITCCRLDAGPFDVEMTSTSSSYIPVQAHTATLCPSHQILKGIIFNTNGAPATLICHNTSAAGHYIFSNGWASQQVLQNGGTTSCGYYEAAVGIGDVYSPDGDVDSFHCSQFVRN